MKKPSLTIGISALNEVENLKRLLPAILSQESDRYILKEIIVYSDGSTDDTYLLHREPIAKNITVILGTRRKGKPLRMNSIFERSTSDLVCIIDADVKLAHNAVLDRLVAAAENFREPMIVSGYVLPLNPQSFVEHIAYAGVAIWNIARDSVGSDSIYHCDGMIRLFTKSAYRTLRFPDHSAEDSYAYLYAKTQNWIFKSVKNALVLYRLPSSYREYLSQQRRYLTSLGIEEDHFDPTLIKKELRISIKDKFSALIHYWMKDPFYTILYCVSSILVRIHLRFFPQSSNSKWHILTTTKFVHP
jgi:glycosyltransferase involved in cell wall biosynthesis